MGFYAGIGSRETPEDMLVFMATMATWLATRGFKFRSGGCLGPDARFEAGHDACVGNQGKEIFLPWRGYPAPKGPWNDSPLYKPTQAAIELSMSLHPNPGACGQGARKLHGRNSHIILGQDLLVPVQFVMCWTKGGQVIGGTGMALRLIAHINASRDAYHQIQVYNLGNREHFNIVRSWITR